ncbi:MAG: hypothetical protein QG610_1730 [Euryarchaeota archaeon]|nr:hypothetical protein [Euryarchaeota archaeon]
MSEKNTRTKIITIKDTKIKSLKIKGLGEKTIIIRNLTLKNVRLIFKLPPEKTEKKE